MAEETRSPSSHPAHPENPDNITGGGGGEIRHAAMFSHSSGVAMSSPVFLTVNGTYLSVTGANHPQQDTELPHGSENVSGDGISHTTPRRQYGSPLNSVYDLYDASNERRASPQIPISRKLFQVKSDVELYSSLDNPSRGVSLHIPQPNMLLSPAARREGVCIGTIGWVTPERSFDSKLNICRSACDPVNPTDLRLSNVAAGFQPDIREFKQFGDRGSISTPGIYSIPLQGTSSRRALVRFGSDREEGALLILPHGAYLQKLSNEEQFLDRFMENAPSLYAYLNNTRDLQIKNGELSVVRSCHKSSSWAIATFQNTSPEFPIRMSLLENSNPSSRSAGSRYLMDCQGTVQSKVGPEDDNDDLEEDNYNTPISSLRNQTIFVQTTRIKLSNDVWQQTFPVSVGSYDGNIFQHINPTTTTLPPPSPTSSKSLPQLLPTASPPLSTTTQPSELSEWSQASGSLYTPPTSVSGHDSDSDISAANDEESVDPSGAFCVHSQRLSDTVTDFLLEMNPGAKAAISSDRDWILCSSLHLSQSDLLDEICAVNDICERNGLVYFEPKEKFPSEDDQRLFVDSICCQDEREFLQVYLFGHKQSCEERCAMLTGLISRLQGHEDHDSTPQDHQKSQQVLLDGHPIRVLSLDYALQAMERHQFYCPSPSIPELRATLSAAQLSKPDTSTTKALHGQRLAESLLKRFCYLGHEDDLHEAIWVFFDALTLTPATSYRRLEIYLDLGSALFIRYQLFQQNDDLIALLSVLRVQHEKESLQLPPYSWIWNGIKALQLINCYSNVMWECMARQELGNGRDGVQEEDKKPTLTILEAYDLAPETDHIEETIDNTNNGGTFEPSGRPTWKEALLIGTNYSNQPVLPDQDKYECDSSDSHTLVDDNELYQKEADLEKDSNTALTLQTLNADGTPKRPMNAFMIFARSRRPQVSAENKAMRTGEISKILSKEWVTMPPPEKQYYLEQAKQLKEAFNSRYPDYVYRRRPNNSRKRRLSDAGQLRSPEQALLEEPGDDNGSVGLEIPPIDGDEPPISPSLLPSYARPYPHYLTR